MQMGTNHFGHFYLTKLLLPRLHSARIVNVSSFGHSLWQVPCDTMHYEQMCHSNTYDPWKAYSLSKNANIVFTRELQRRFSTSHKIRAYSLHPGVVYTELDRHMGISTRLRTLLEPIRFVLIKTALEGAQTNLFCAVSNDAKPGEYHVDCQAVSVLNKYADDERIARDWWDYSERIIDEKLMKLRGN
jgi:NAD(P)-dependent dehydrogenase (short-subunit alcohol dehydrogenase family)